MNLYKRNQLGSDFGGHSSKVLTKAPFPFKGHTWTDLAHTISSSSDSSAHCTIRTPSSNGGGGQLQGCAPWPTTTRDQHPSQVVRVPGQSPALATHYAPTTYSEA